MSQQPIISDKLSTHGYQFAYSFFLRSLPRENVSILEVGYDKGLSEYFWYDKFPGCSLTFVDINPPQAPHFSRTNLIQLDQSSNEAIFTFLDTHTSQYDLIVDDGSHHPFHQKITFNSFFNHLLKPGGVYIIEDIEHSYWKFASAYGYSLSFGLFSRLSLVNAFKVAIDFVNRLYLSPRDRQKITLKCRRLGFDLDALSSVSSISFSQNLIILRKKTLEESTFRDLMGMNYKYSTYTCWSSALLYPCKKFISKRLGRL